MVTSRSTQINVERGSSDLLSPLRRGGGGGRGVGGEGMRAGRKEGRKAGS